MENLDDSIYDELEVLKPLRKDKKEDRDKRDSDSDVEYESSDSAVDELQQPSSSSDSEPEDVGFKESKQQTLGQVKLAVQQIRTEKERKKLKRKERDDLYRRQKLKKMEELEKKKLPDDILNQITTPTTVTNSDEKSKSTIDKDIEAMLDSDYDEDDEHGNDISEDYIPFNNEKVQAVYVQQSLKSEAKSSAERAADFRQRWLYGSRVNRQSVKKMNAIKKKRAEFKT